MQWTNGTHAGFSVHSPWQAVGNNYPANNVEIMDENPNSILRHYKKLISIRNEHEALRRGQALLLENKSDKIFSLARVYQDKAVLVVSNTGTAIVNPTISLLQSALPPGEYFVTELLGNQPFGKITINDQGGFSDIQISGHTLVGRGSWILLISAENPITSIDETQPKSKIHLTPNPAKDYFQIERADGNIESMQIQVFSADGKLVYKNLMSSDKLQIETSGWQSGIYFVHLSYGSEYVVKLLVLEKT
jgi:hypothetical protein